MHHLEEVADFSLGAVEVLIFDEADRLFEMGFADQLQQLLAAVPEQRQCLLFSATMPRALVAFARAGCVFLCVRARALGGSRVPVRLSVHPAFSPSLPLPSFIPLQ